MNQVIPQALEVFVKGFSFTRSITHRYVAEKIGPLWVMRDAPRQSGNYRNEEWVAYNVTPEEIDSIARAHTRGRYAVCVIHSIDEPAGRAPQRNRPRLQICRGLRH